MKNVIREFKIQYENYIKRSLECLAKITTENFLCKTATICMDTSTQTVALNEVEKMKLNYKKLTNKEIKLNRKTEELINGIPLTDGVLDKYSKDSDNNTNHSIYMKPNSKLQLEDDSGRNIYINNLVIRRSTKKINFINRNRIKKINVFLSMHKKASWIEVDSKNQRNIPLRINSEIKKKRNNENNKDLANTNLPDIKTKLKNSFS